MMHQRNKAVFATCPDKTSYPLVSVIMPCYNDGSYIAEAIASVQKQTYPNIELIIINDGSDDSATLKVLQSLNGSNLHVMETDHAGPAQARNAGIAQAKGKYILPLDADDWIESEYIRKAAALLENNSELGIVYCIADTFGQVEGPWNLPEFSVEEMLVDNCIFVSSLFRKTDWQTVGGFCDEFIHGLEDYDFWLSLIELGRGVTRIPETLFHYRIKQESRTHSFSSDTNTMAETYQRLYNRHKKLYHSHMDAYCQKMRMKMIQDRFLIRKGAEDTERLSQIINNDNVVAHWRSIRENKPRLARAIERFIRWGRHMKALVKRKM